MLILGIETSCDETAGAIVKNGKEILSNVVASSVELHAKTGGIIPENAAREQIKAIISVIDLSLKNAGVTKDQIDTIAVTVGPGLIGSLLVGVETAKTLSFCWNKPLVPVNHLVGHIYANWLENTPPTLPALALVVSGGHTDIVLIKTHGEIRFIGGTRDDAAGEAFDKTARLLNLGYPGGPAVSKAASKHDSTTYNLQPTHLPRPLLNKNGYDFSFSGLKTAVLREVTKLKDNKLLNERSTNALAHETEEAITEVVVQKTLKAAQEYKVETLLVAGGVAANSRLREKFKQRIQDSNLNLDFRIPPPKLCTDNATFIAAYAEYNYKPTPWQEVNANPSLTIDSVI